MRVVVTLRRDAEGVQFTLADDGVGMDPARRDAGDGLIGMRDRIGAVGGTLDIATAPGQGTTVLGTIPGPRRAERSGPRRGPASAGHVG